VRTAEFVTRLPVGRTVTAVRRERERGAVAVTDKSAYDDLPDGVLVADADGRVVR
jgi:hypothetical protein